MNHNCNKEDMFVFIRDDLKEIREDVKYLIKTTSSLKVKASIAGVLSGGIGAAVILAIEYIK